MTFWRKLGVVGLCLSLLEGVVEMVDPDSAVGTATEIAMMTAVLGFGGDKPAPHRDQPNPEDVLSLLSR